MTKTNYAIDKTINWYKDTYFKYKLSSKKFYFKIYLTTLKKNLNTYV